MVFSYRVCCFIVYIGIGDVVGDDFYLLFVCKGQIFIFKFVCSGVCNGRVGSNFRLRFGFCGWCVFGVDG